MLALLGFLLVAGSVLFALFTYEEITLDGIAIPLFFCFVIPPVSPAILFGFVTAVIAGVRYAQSRQRI